MSVAVDLSAALNPPRALGPQRLGGRLRESPEDFQVEEMLGFTPDGDGPHVWMLLRKRGMNTEQAARELARICAVATRDVGYAGLKDRNAVTCQWFSVPAGDAARACAARAGELIPGLELLASSGHGRKLRRGANRGNRFQILVRDPRCPDRQDVLEGLVELVRARGVPNYYGRQRFGREGANVGKALAMFDGRARRTPRHLRSLFLSSARSLLFNQVLARRVRDGSWDCLLPGEAVMLNGRNSYFLADDGDADLARRLAIFDVHPSGPLWGRGEPVARREAAALEAEVAALALPLCRGLADAGLDQERRALRLPVPGLQLRTEPGVGWRLGFDLPRGSYATTVLRELFDAD